MERTDRRRTALVTGTNRGTGRAIRDALTAAGYDVISINRTPCGDGSGAEFLCDLSDLSGVAATLRQVEQRLDRLDLVVLNAAVRTTKKVIDTTPQDWSTSLSVNVAAPAVIVTMLLPKLRECSGLVVLIGSHAADRFFDRGALYSSSKAAARALVETLLIEERPNGVRSMVLSAGAIANRAEDESPFKMAPESVGRLVVTLADGLPEDIAVGEIEIRPAKLDPTVPTGMVRLQSV